MKLLVIYEEVPDVCELYTVYLNERQAEEADRYDGKYVNSLDMPEELVDDCLAFHAYVKENGTLVGWRHGVTRYTDTIDGVCMTGILL